jgi:hypothetical protein
LNFFWAAGASFEIPMTAVFFFSNASTSSRKSQASCVQPGVIAFEKKNTTTRFPAKSESFTTLPASSASANSGAFFPTSSAMVEP